jgi:hypothetical protein
MNRFDFGGMCFGIGSFFGAIVMGLMLNDPLYEKGYRGGQISIMVGDEPLYKLTTNSINEITWTEVSE